MHCLPTVTNVHVYTLHAHVLPTHLLNSTAALFLSSNTGLSWSQHLLTEHCACTCPQGVRSPSRYMFSSLTASLGMLSTLATWDTTCSIIIIPWGPPKPRNAVLGAMCVRQALATARKLGILYALSQWVRIFSKTCRQRKSVKCDLFCCTC